MQKNKKSATKKTQSKKPSLLKRIWNIICWPFRKIANLCRRIWNWICKINIIGLTNLTLLLAIIILFCMLIIDVTDCFATSGNKSNNIPCAEKNLKRRVVPRAVLPIKQNPNKNKVQSVSVVPVNKVEITEAKKQIAEHNNKFYGDIIVDNRGAAHLIKNGATINGNLFLQNMRKYVLPCDIRVNGNVFVRDVNQMQFCGDFVITGNIYVSPRSSFGPVPGTARLGGQVIL